MSIERERSREGEATIAMPSPSGRAVAAPPKGRWKPPTWLVIATSSTICLLMAAVVVAVAISPDNRPACAGYEAAYNDMMAAVTTINDHSTADPMAARATIDDTPTRLTTAATSAHDGVAAAMQVSVAAADAYLADESALAGRAFFFSADGVREACVASGAQIDLSTPGN